jgi:DNA polymerase III subunit beta
MKFSIQRERLLKPLQQIIGAVERRQTMPMLGNILLRSNESGMTMTATDLEIELIATVQVEIEGADELTLPARKLLDICRALPEGVNVTINSSEGKASIHAMRSRFVLATLPAADFPVLENIPADHNINVTEAQLKHLIDCAAFAMAQQDVRYYLNGLLLHVDQDLLRTVATDGHRLATCGMSAELQCETPYQVIIPRKGVHELQRLLTNAERVVEVEISANHIRANLPDLCFTSKLIDGRFPDYDRVVPKDADKTAFVDRSMFRQALIRTAILSSEKYRGVRLGFQESTMKLQAHNPDQEEAEEEIEIDYDGRQLEIGFNVNYLLDVLGAIESDNVEIKLTDPNSSALLKVPASEQALYVVMPMRL